MRLLAATLAVFAVIATEAMAKSIKVVDSRYGDIVVDGKGLTLYLFTKEESAKARCYGACAKAWPPLFVKRAPKAGDGIDAGLIGTTKRRKGRLQATYNGHPLYYYVDEDDPGEIFCQDVFEFGGTWLLVNPEGRAVT